MHSKVIPNRQPENLNEEDRENDANYEGLEDSKDIDTYLTNDGGLLNVNGTGPSNSPRKTRNATTVFQEGNFRCPAHDRLAQREDAVESQMAYIDQRLQLEPRSLGSAHRPPQ